MLFRCGSENYQNKFKFKTVDRRKVKEVIKKLSNSTVVGMDGISLKVLKDGIEVLDVHLAWIINLSIVTCINPAYKPYSKKLEANK